MEVFASYDLTLCDWSAAQLVGCDPKTVRRYVDLRDAGFNSFQRFAGRGSSTCTWRRWRSW